MSGTNGPWAYNTSSASTSHSPTLDELLEISRRLAPPPTEPIIAVNVTASELQQALETASVKTVMSKVYPPPLSGLDVVEEDGWSYVGTMRQIADARQRWGSLAAARMAWERSEAVRGEGCK